MVTIIKNEFLIGGAGQLPPTEVWPELWIVQKEDEKAAKKIVHEFIQSTKTRLQDWVCTECGERIEGQFNVCWNCGSGNSIT